jgi:hypothetical protein
MMERLIEAAKDRAADLAALVLFELVGLNDRVLRRYGRLTMTRITREMQRISQQQQSMAYGCQDPDCPECRQQRQLEVN